MIEWKTLDSKAKLESIIEESYQRPQVIFKHSTTCPISGMAKRRVDSEWSNAAATPYFLDLLAFRSVSNAVADTLGVQHESPQLILIHKGMAVYDESHLDIDISSLNEEIEKHLNE